MEAMGEMGQATLLKRVHEADMEEKEEDGGQERNGQNIFTNDM